MLNERSLPPEVMEEIKAVSGKMVSEFESAKGRKVQIWWVHTKVVLIEIYPDGELFIWTPLVSDRDGPRAAAALRGFIHSEE